MAKTFTTSLRVRFSDLDLYGHVHHAELLKHMEWARMEYLKQAGVPLTHLMENGIYIVIVNATVDFLSPSYYDEELIISGSVQSIGTTSLTMIQTVDEKQTGRSVAGARFTFVFLDEKRRKMAVPEDKLGSFLE